MNARHRRPLSRTDFRLGQLFSGLAAGPTQARRAGADQCGRDLLPAGGVHAADGASRRVFGCDKPFQVTGLADGQELDDEAVEAFRTRPLDAGPYTFVAADALVLKVREAGRVVGVHTLIATGVNAEGYREILGIQVSSAEDGAGWLAFFRDLVARGLSGVGLVTSDAHPRLVAAIGATLPGAAWQRCRTHYTTNLMSGHPEIVVPWVRTLCIRSSTSPTPNRLSPDMIECSMR